MLKIAKFGGSSCASSEQFEKVKNYSPKEFVEKVLIDTLNANEVYCGFNFTFGKDKSGNVDILKKLLKKKIIRQVHLLEV